MAKFTRRQLFTLAASSLITSKVNSADKHVLGKKGMTGLLLDKGFSRHFISAEHPESPARYHAITRHILDNNLQQQVSLLTHKHNCERWLTAVHSKQHINTIKSEQPETHKNVLLATSALLSVVDAVCTHKVTNAFCASRPPGHHAKNMGQEEGFCYYNHIAIAARYAQQTYQLKKILIIDWDYHHGNGTEWAFYSDPSVLFFSTHDMISYPGTGLPSRQGEGAGKGFNINVHLACGATDKDIIEAFKKTLLPAADAFSPDLILISAGFDSRQDDLLGCHNITDQGFAELTHLVKSIAARHCNGRLVSLLEGGYNIEGNARAVVAHINALNSDL